ncbi:MAG: hypothetical protein WCO21_03700 [bacterium]
MSKKETLEYLKGLFLKHHVLDMKQLYKAIDTTSHATVFRYLCELHHLTSYTHNGKYYTLSEIAQFDPNGFWYYGDIGFSSQGTLVSTLAHVIAVSESGKTNSELEAHFRTRVQDALRTLLNNNKIVRTRPADRYLYVSSDPDISDRQIKKRMKVGGRKRLPDWVVGEILVETIRSFPGQPEVEEVVKRLSKRGSLITREQVTQVFEENHLQKKTPV